MFVLGILALFGNCFLTAAYTNTTTNHISTNTFASSSSFSSTYSSRLSSSLGTINYPSSSTLKDTSGSSTLSDSVAKTLTRSAKAPPHDSFILSTGASSGHTSAARNNATSSAASPSQAVIYTRSSANHPANPPYITSSPSIGIHSGKSFTLPPGSGLRAPGSNGFPITAGPRLGSTGQLLNPLVSTTNASHSTDSSLLSSCRSVYDTFQASQLHDYVNEIPSNQTYTRPAVCSALLENYCQVWVDGVNLLYWPTPYATTGPNATTVEPPTTTDSTLVSGTFTFTSETAYLVYLNLNARLPYNTLSSNLGTIHTDLTIGYPQDSILTWHDCGPQGYWPKATVNYQDYNRPPKWSVVSSQRPCHPWSDAADSLSDQVFPPADIATEYTDWLNKPVVVLADDLKRLDPAWSTCVMGDTGLGLFDPAMALSSGSAMVALTATATSTAGYGQSDVTGGTAQPASSIIRVVPTQTSVVMTLANGDTIVHYPPAGVSISPQYAQAASRPSSSTSIFQGRPLPFDPDVTASPEPSPSTPTSSQGAAGIQAAVANSGFSNPITGASTIVVSGSGSGSASNVADPAGSNPGSASGESSGVIQDGNTASFSLSDSPSSAPTSDTNPGTGFSSDTNANTQPESYSKGIAGTGPNASDDNRLGGGGSPSATSTPSTAIGGYNIQPGSDGTVVVNGISLSPASPTVTLSGIQFSLQSSGIVIGGHTIPTPQPVAGSSAPAITLNGHNVQVSTGSSGPQLLVDGEVIPAGTAQATVGGNVITILPGGQISVLPTTLAYTPQPVSAEVSATETFPGSTPEPALLPASEMNVAGAILDAWGRGPTTSSTPVAGVNTNSDLTSATPRTFPTPIASVIAGQTFIPLANGNPVIGGTTLSGNGQTVQLQNGDEVTLTNGALIAGTTSIPLTATTSAEVSSPISSAFVVIGETIVPMGTTAIAIDGTVISLPTNSASGQSLPQTNGASSSALSASTNSYFPPTTQPTSANIVIQSDGNVVYDGITLSTNAPAITLSDGEIISLAQPASSSPTRVSTTTTAPSSSPNSSAGTIVSSVSQLDDIPSSTISASKSKSSTKSAAATTSDVGLLGMGAVHGGTSGAIKRCGVGGINGGWGRIGSGLAWATVIAVGTGMVALF